MSEYRIRPKSDYLHNASLDSLYALSEHWMSDIQFYNTEISFLEDLIGRYYLWLKDESFNVDLANLIEGLKEMSTLCSQLLLRIERHMNQIELLDENPFSHDEQSFRDEHMTLEDDLSSFLKNLRTMKQVVFNVSEMVMQHQRLQHLLPK